MKNYLAPLRPVLRRCLVVALTGVPVPAFAAAEPWQVEKVSGRVWLTGERNEAAAIAPGMYVDAGVTIFTGARSRVMLSHGADTMVIGPNSIVAVSQHPTQGLSTTILEKAGTATFDVGRERGPHFSVETPMLAAVVKGTHFTVDVGRAEGGVAVARGVVGVTALASGQMTDVGAGQRANVGSHGLSVSGTGHRAAIRAIAPQRAIVAPLSPAVALGAFTSTELSASATVATPSSTASAAPGPQGPSSANASTTQNNAAATSSASTQTAATTSLAASNGDAVSASSTGTSQATAAAAGNTADGGRHHGRDRSGQNGDTGASEHGTSHDRSGHDTSDRSKDGKDGSDGKNGSEGKNGSDGKSGHGNSGNANPGNNNSGNGKSGNTKSGDGKSGDGKSGDGRSGDGKSGDGKSDGGRNNNGASGHGRGHDR